MPSNLARACSRSLQKGIDGSAFRGMIDAARAAAAAARRTAVGAAGTEPEPETTAEEEAAATAEETPRPAAEEEAAAEVAAGTAAEEAGFLHSWCNFVANWRRRAAPRRRRAMVEEEELVDVLWRAQVVYQKKDFQKQLVQEELAERNSFVQCGEHWFKKNCFGWVKEKGEKKRSWEWEGSRLLSKAGLRSTCRWRQIEIVIYHTYHIVGYIQVGRTKQCSPVYTRSGDSERLS